MSINWSDISNLVDQTAKSNLEENSLLCKCWYQPNVSSIDLHQYNPCSTLQELDTEFQQFQSIYHKKNALIDALDLALQEKKMVEAALDDAIKDKQLLLSKKRKRATEDSIQGGKRVKFAAQLESVMHSVKELSERVDNTEQDLSNLDDMISCVSEEMEELQGQVEEIWGEI